MKYLILIPILFLASCASTDPLTLANLERGYEIYLTTHKEVVEDDVWIDSGEEAQKNTMPASEDAAHRWFYENAIEYEDTKGTD